MASISSRVQPRIVACQVADVSPLCSGVHYVVILSEQLLHAALFWCDGPLIMLAL